MHKLFLILALSLAACSQQVERTASEPAAAAATQCYTLPSGFTVVEQSPLGLFVRVASTARPSAAEIAALADSLGSHFDRIDFCLDVAHERGDEYLSVIDGKVYDYAADQITNLDNYGHE